MKRIINWLRIESQRLKVKEPIWKPKTTSSEHAWRTEELSQISDVVITHYFATREDARNYKKYTERALTRPKVTYEQVAMPDESGWING